MNNTVCTEDFILLLKDALDKGQDFSFNPTGSSMKPMLNGVDDTVVLTKAFDKLIKYDVALFVRRSDNALVLHRVVKVTGDSYTMSGDSQYFFDENVAHSDILAVMKSFVRSQKPVSVTDFSYRFYCRKMLIKKYIHIFFSKLYHKIFK